MLSVKNLTKIYKIKGKGVKQVLALDNVSIDFPETGMVFLLGKSGSGKSTLLNTIGGLDTFNDGEIMIKGKSSKDFHQGDFDAYRNTFIGFIFQEYNILEEFSIGKNLALALELQGKKANPAAVNALLDKVDLSGYYKRKPNQLSGGQKQRVAIARALIKDPEIIMADEPTGALDSNTGKQVMDTLKKLSQEKLVIVVSHDREFAEIYGDRVIELKDGHIISDTTKHKVSADKSASGVSYIDNKIIHIKKGQKLDKEDLIKINQMIIANSENQDTIISFDEKPNREIKKTAFITDDGNREVFTNTTQADLDMKTYDPKQFKLIRSKMRIRDAFKMGSSSLKHKPVRLFFTILLSFLAFAMFGLVDTFASWDIASSTYEAIKMTNTKTIAFSGVEKGENGTRSKMITQDDAQTIRDRHSNYNFYNVIYGSSGNYSTPYWRFGDDYNSPSSGDIYSHNSSGILPLTDEVMGNLNLELVEGRRPTASDEVVISQHIFNCIKRSNKTITDFSGVDGKNFQITTGNKTSPTFKIVGVMKDDTDISKYVKSNDNSNSENIGIKDVFNYYEMSAVTGYGLLNMSYVSPECYNTLAQTYKITQNFGYSFNKESSWWSAYDSYFHDISVSIAAVQHRYRKSNDWGYYYEYNTDNGDEIPEGAEPYTYTDALIAVKDGADVNHLKDDEVVLSSSAFNYFTQNYSGDKDQSNWSTILNEGVTLHLTKDNKPFRDLKVVAVAPDGSNFEISSNLYREWFSATGCDYMVTRVKGNNEDMGLVKDLVNYQKDGKGYAIQFKSSYTLQGFESLTASLRQAFLYVGIGFAVFASFLLMNFISTSINYKKREIGVLRAIGAGKKDVFSIFFSESFVIAVINFILAAVATFTAAYFINRSLYQSLGFAVPLLVVGIRQVILLIAVSLGVAFISTLLPVYKIARKNPIDSINNR